MSALWTVTRWEFLRYLRWRQELVGLLVMMGVLGALYGGSRWIADSKAAQEFEVAVLDLAGLAPDPAAAGRVRLTPVEASERAAVAAAVGAGELFGLLEIESRDRATLLVDRDPEWLGELRQALDQARLRQVFAEEGVAPEDFARWTAPVEVELSYHELGRDPTTLAQRVAAVLVLLLSLGGVMTCFGYFFASITSEKQARIGEQIVSAIPTQTWIDGKWLGICGQGVKAMVQLGLWAALVGYGVHLFAPHRLAGFGAVEPAALAVAALFLLLGLLFWGSFLAAVAATIDDPHSSSRSSLMLVPTIPASLMFLTLDAVDHPAMWVASHLPLTSMAAMPVRALLGEVHGLEVLLSALVLAACTALMRRYASRVFRAHMLLYGKEPTWRELWRCLRSDEAGRG